MNKQIKLGIATLVGVMLGTIGGRYTVAPAVAGVALADKAKGMEDEVKAASAAMLGASIVKASQPEAPLSVESAIASTKSMAKGVLNGLYVDKFAPTAYTTLGLGYLPNYHQDIMLTIPASPAGH